jgi:GNAT superfamily N-acetyltransferase
VTELEIRAAGPVDVPRITEVFQQARAAAMPWLPVLHTPDEDLAFFARTVGSGHAVVAVLDGTVVGFAAVDPDEHLLDHLYVDPAAHRRGVGRRLVDHARAAHDGPLQLWAFTENRSARRFYAAVGAVELYETDGSGNEERTPDVRLELPAWGARPGEREAQ